MFRQKLYKVNVELVSIETGKHKVLTFHSTARFKWRAIHDVTSYLKTFNIELRTKRAVIHRAHVSGEVEG